MPTLVDGLNSAIASSSSRPSRSPANLVDSLNFGFGKREFGGDLSCGLRRTTSDGVHQQAWGAGAVPREGSSLLAAEVGEIGTGRTGVQSTLDVSVRLAVPHQYQSAAHGISPAGVSPARSRASHRSASSG